MQYIAQHARVESQEYTDTIAHIEATMETARIENLATFGDDVQIIHHASE